MKIKRDAYLDTLVGKIDNGLIKILVGLRRCGKSFILNTIFYDYLIKHYPRDGIIKFAFDSQKNLSEIGEDAFDVLSLKKKVDSKKFINFIDKKLKGHRHYFLLLDEIQFLDNFELVLNGYLGQNNIDIYVTGSNAKFLSSDVVTEFRGRGDVIKIHPLSFYEYYNFCKKDFNSCLEEYMTYGGLPLTVLNKTKKDKLDYLDHQLNATYIRDIIDRYHITKKISRVKTLFNILASGTSSLTNPLKLANTFASQKMPLSHTQIEKYITYFQESFVINVVNRFDVKGKKYIQSPYKVYFEDLGIRNSILNFRQFERGHLMENLIYNELITRGYRIDVGAVKVREKDKNGKEIEKTLEIDFVINDGSQRFYIQSVYDINSDEKNRQETKSLSRINDSFQKIIIVNENAISHYTDEGYLIFSLKDFLTSEKLSFDIKSNKN